MNSRRIEVRQRRQDAEASARGEPGDPAAGRSDLRDHLHLPDDGGVVLRGSGLPNRGDLHAEHPSV